MARARPVKPEFWTSEQIVNCTRDARLIFIGIWIFSDDSGIHPASYKTIKMEVFPADQIQDEEIIKWINELIEQDLLIEYEVNGRKYWKVTGWERHQNIQHKYFKYPLPDGKIPIAENKKGTKKLQDNTGIIPVLSQNKRSTGKNGNPLDKSYQYNTSIIPLSYDNEDKRNNVNVENKGLQNGDTIPVLYQDNTNPILVLLEKEKEIKKEGKGKEGSDQSPPIPTISFPISKEHKDLLAKYKLDLADQLKRYLAWCDSQPNKLPNAYGFLTSIEIEYKKMIEKTKPISKMPTAEEKKAALLKGEIHSLTIKLNELKATGMEQFCKPYEIDINQKTQELQELEAIL